MTSEQFAYWLQGFAELNEQPPSNDQWQMIRDHLALVFNKVTPTYPKPRIDPTWQQPTPIDFRPTVTCQTPAGHTATRATC